MVCFRLEIITLIEPYRQPEAFLGINVAFVQLWVKILFCSVFFRLECSGFALFFRQNVLRKSSDFIYFCSVYIIEDTANGSNKQRDSGR